MSEDEQPASVPAPERGAVSARSVLIGLLCVAGLVAAVPYNDYRLQNTFLYGNHLPIGGIFLLMLLTLGVNAFLYRFRPARVLRVSELAVIWSMVLVAGGIASSGGMRYLLPLPVGLIYYRPSNGAWDRLIAEVPDWMLPSRDPSSPVVLGFFEGLPPGVPVPWSAWVRPVLGWGVGFLLLLVLFFCLASLLRRQWVDNERLTFPLVQLPLEMIQAPERGRAVNSFYRSPWMWTGFLLASIIHSTNGLHTYFASFPELPLRIDTSKAFPDRPWSALGINDLRIYFSIIGISYLLSTEVSLSLWFFFVGLRLIRVFRASIGLDPVRAGFFSQESAWVFGAMLAWAAAMLWLSLPYLMRTVRAAIRGESAGERGREVVSYRAAWLGIAASLVGLLVWGRAAGIAPGYMLLITAVFVLMTLMVTRAVAEGGILMVQLPFIPHDALAPLMGSGWIKPASWASGTVYQAVFMHDLREAQMPSVMHAFKLRDVTGRMPGAQLVGALALAVLVAFAVSTVMFLINTYHYGAINLDSWGMRNAPRSFYNRGGQVLTKALLPDTGLALNVLGGAAAGLVVALLRLRLLWWPFHPLGLVLANSWATSVIWFSIFLAWALKVVAMRYGGLRFYRQSLPFFLGIVLGEGFTAVVWVIVGAITGAGAVRFLPE